MKLRSRRLSKDISELISCWDVIDDNWVRLVCIADKMIANVDVWLVDDKQDVGQW
jgi:hypothetical protein